ncbi:unnamed protein product, partial [marine sediment metagenome]
VVGGIGGATLTGIIAALLAAKPAEAATPDEKVEYLIEALTTLIPVLAGVAEGQTHLVEGQTQLVEAIQQWLAAQGIAPPGVEVTVSAPWVAREPEQIFSQAIRTAALFYSDKMVNWTRGKRLLIKVESSLDQDCDIQVIGNIADTRELATDVGDLLTCLAGGNISAGPAWDDWHPYIGVRIITALGPTAGILTIAAVIQE